MPKSGSLKSYFAALALVASAFWPGAGSAQDAVGTLTGVVTDAAGAPLEGAFVQMKNAERRLYFMVISKDQGKYTNNQLPPGKYVVQAIGGEHQSAPSAAVEVAAGKSAPSIFRSRWRAHRHCRRHGPGRQPGQRGAAPVSDRSGPLARARPSSRRNAWPATTRSGSSARAATRRAGGRSCTA